LGRARAWGWLQVCLATLTIAGAPWAAPRLEQANAGEAAATPLVIALPVPSRVGDTIVVAMWAAGGSPLCTVSDSLNTYVDAAPPATGFLGTTTLQVMFATITNAPTLPLKLTVITCSAMQVRVLEYSGLAAVAPVDAYAAEADYTSPLFDAGVVTTAPGDLLVAYVVPHMSVGAGDPAYPDQMVFEGDLIEDRVAGPPGSYQATATTPAGGFVAQFVAFKADPTADAGPLPPPAEGMDLGAGFRFEQANSVLVGTSPLLVALPHPSRAGNAIFVCVRGAPGGCTISDTAGDSYAMYAEAPGQGVLASETTALYGTVVQDGGTAPIEISVTCSTFARAYVAEYSGLADGGPDQTTGQSSTTSTVVSVGPVVTGFDSELVVSCGTSAGDVVPVDGGLVMRASLAGGGLLDAVTGRAGPYTATAASTVLTWDFAFATFRGTGVPDAGTDAGITDAGVQRPSAQRLVVACGCSASPSALGLLLSLVFVGRRRTAHRRYSTL
jgi:hypothetical protein